MILPGSQLAACNAELPVANIAFDPGAQGACLITLALFFQAQFRLLCVFKPGFPLQRALWLKSAFAPSFRKLSLAH